MAYGATLVALMLAVPTSAGFNPALTVAVYLADDRERLPGFLPYRFAAQLAGAGLGALLAVFAVRCFSLPLSGAGRLDDVFCNLFLAGVGAFSVSFAYLKTCEAEGTAPLRAAATGTMAFAAAAVMGGHPVVTFNPAVYLGLALSGFLEWDVFGAATVATLVGAAAAVSLWLLGRKKAD